MAYILKQVQQHLPNGIRRTHYMRLAGMGDGPVTSPHQDPTTGEIQMPDDYVGSGPAPSDFDSSSNQVVATVGPIITGVTGALTSTADWLKNALSGGNSTPGAITTTVTGTGPAASAAGSGITLPILLVLGAVGYGGYRLLHKKKGGR